MNFINSGLKSAAITCEEISQFVTFEDIHTYKVTLPYFSSLHQGNRWHMATNTKSHVDKEDDIGNKENSGVGA